MFNFFKKNNGNKQSKKEEQNLPQMLDLNNMPLQEGDIVDCLRYDMGKSKLILVEGVYFYESLQSGERVSWAKMIDAATELQKVKKI